MRKLLKWVFKKELSELEMELSRARNVVGEVEKQQKKLNKVLSYIDVSVDVHEYNYSPSWAVISLQGQKTDYIKFVDLGQSDINEISKFLRGFERSKNIKIDASPIASKFLHIKK